jgi:hypothetical protein
MKKMLLPGLSLAVLLALTGMISCKEKTAGTKTGTGVPDIPREHLVTDKGLGDLRIGMTEEEVEKTVDAQIALTNTNEDIWVDSVKVKYGDVPLVIFFERQYKSDDTYYMAVSGFKLSSDLCKTDKGIGMGSHQDDIIRAYDGYIINMFPDFVDTTYTERSKTRSIINVSLDESESLTIFTLDNKKVAGIELARNYHGE